MDEQDASHKGGSLGFWAVEPRDSEDGSLDINFRVLRNNAPREQRDLKNEVERSLTTVKVIYRDSKDRQKLREAFSKLIALAQVGLVGENASPIVASDALRAFEADVLDREAGPIKNAYMLKLGKWAVSFSIVTTAAYLFCDRFPFIAGDQIYMHRSMFLVLVGCMAGAWASFAARKVSLSFADLGILEEDRVEPPLRLIFTGILTIMLALVFLTGLADVHLGYFKASDIRVSGSVALLVGAFAGLAEQALPSALMSRATDFISRTKVAN